MKRKKDLFFALKVFFKLFFWIYRDSKGSQLSLRSTKSGVTVVPDEGIANDDENVATEEAANNLEEKLEPEETVEEEGANKEEAEEET